MRKMKTRKSYIGMWRITEMSEWDKDFIDLVAPGYIMLKSDGTGTLAFGAIEADLDCRIEKPGTIERLSFSFAGWDEGEDISGHGWAEISGNIMSGWICFHMGDETTFKALRKGTEKKKVPTRRCT
jgi:hypothetical protein